MITETVPNVAKNPHERIAAAAYCIWEKEGRPHGRHVEQWLQAETQLTVDSAQDASRKAPAKNVASAVAQALPGAKKTGQGGRWAKAPPSAASATRW